MSPPLLPSIPTILTPKLGPRVVCHAHNHTHFRTPTVDFNYLPLPLLHDEQYVCGRWMELSNGDA